MVVTWSDDEIENENEDLTVNVVKALTVKNNVQETFSDGEITDHDLDETSKLLYTKWAELCVVCETQKKLINNLTQEKGKAQENSIWEEKEHIIQVLRQDKKKLQVENAELQEDVSLLEVKLESVNKSLRMLNNGTNALDGILEASKKGRSMKGIGYNSTNQEGQNSNGKFVVPEDKAEVLKQVDHQKLSTKSQHGA